MKLSLEYIAGFFDGEGCVNMSRTRTHVFPRVLIVNTERLILEMLQKQFGGDIQPITHRRKDWKPSWLWRLSGLVAVDFLYEIEPWLVIKREQAWTAIAWAEIRPRNKSQRTPDFLEAVQLIVDRIKWLNRKGPQRGEDPIEPILREIRSGQAELKLN